MLQKIKKFIKKETVLSIAMVLAIVSMFIVPPDRGYISYIDYRTLAILFCLMTIVACFRNMGVFDWFAQKMLLQVKSMAGIVTVLVMLSFFLSMLITNDVALITFVPLAIIVFQNVEKHIRNHWMMFCIVLQTVAANLGSMLTPIGNPQNLFLYGKAIETGKMRGIVDFIKLMLPYSILSLVMLLLCIVVMKCVFQNDIVDYDNNNFSVKKEQLEKKQKEYIFIYAFLFVVSFMAVAHKIHYLIPFFLVLVYTGARNRQILKQVDYTLLATFIALFIFIGNLGRIPQFRDGLSYFIDGRTMFTAVLASQVMSNVPAAVLLEKFTNDIPGLIVGTNLGGLGTLIASMASLISFKYVAKEDSCMRGKYFLLFTSVNIAFLILMLCVWMVE